MSLLRRIASNAMANVFIGGSATVFQVGVTAVAARIFDTPRFSAWTLAFSLAALTPLFAANLSAVVTRLLVKAENGGSNGQQAAVMLATRQVAIQLSVVAAITIVLIGLILRLASASLASVPLWVFLATVLVLTLGQLWQIVLQPVVGWHYARQHNWIVAGGTALARSLSLIAVGLAAWFFKDNLVATALCIAAGTWFGLAIAIKNGFHGLREPVADAAAISDARAETLHLVRGFAIWSVGAAVIQYGLPPFMSVISGAHYNGFYLAYTLNLVVTGIGAASASALLVPVTHLLTNKNSNTMIGWMNWAPAITGLTLVVFFLVLLLGTGPLVQMWAPGKASGADVGVYLYLLGFQALARFMALIFSVVLTAVGSSVQLRTPIIMELILTVLAALPIGWVYGDQAFIMALAGIGLISAIVTAATTVHLMQISIVAGRSIMVRFLATQIFVLVSWYFLGKWFGK